MTADSATDFSEKLAGVAHRRQSVRLWLRLLSCSIVIEKRIRIRLDAEFCTTLPRFDALAALERHPQGITMSALSNAMLVSNGNVTGVIARLVEDGLVIRAHDPKDRRVSNLRLSARGRAKFARMAAAHAEWIDEFFADLPEADVTGLLRLLKNVRISVERKGGGAA